MTRTVPALACLGTMAALTAVIHRDFPLVGHDFAYFVPRLLDTDLHVRINGLVPQWYTPSFGGGLPAFANPQHIQYSLPQALLYLFSPWTAILASTALVSAIGFAALHHFLRETLGFESLPSTLGACFFIGNGFYIEHMTVGHLGFQLFPLGALILAALTSRSRSVPVHACVIALAIAMILHQGGAFILILLAGSIVLAVQVVAVLVPARVDWRRVIAIGGLALPLSMALAGSKIYAVQSLMRHFPREVADVYPVGLFQGLIGLAVQLGGAMTIVPVLLLGGFPTQRLDDALIRVTGAGVHVWELDAGLSPVLLVVLLVGVIQGVRAIRNGEARAVPFATTMCLLGLALTTWFAVETTLAKGIVYPMVKSLPVFRSLHVNHRVAAVFILPLIIVGVWLINRWSGQWRPARLIGAICLTVMAPTVYLVLPSQVHRRIFDLTQSLNDHTGIRAGERFPVTRVESSEDFESISQGTSSLNPYEPLFGYDREQLAPRVRVGDIYVERNGTFNMTNPASLVFPELNRLRPFDLIMAEDRLNLERLANRGQPDWPVPRVVHWLNLTAIAALVICTGIVTGSLLNRWLTT